MTTPLTAVDTHGLDENLNAFWRMWRLLETYKLIYGELEDPYGKVDTLLAYRTYREKEPFLQNFARYMEALRVKLESTPAPQDGSADPEAPERLKDYMENK